MRTLSAGAEIQRQRVVAQPIYLLKVEFTAPSALTLYFSDISRTKLGFDWSPFVLTWGNVDAVLGHLKPEESVGVLEGLALRNDKPIEGKDRLSDLIRTRVNTSGSYEWAFAKATLYQIFEGAGLDSGDEININVFYIEEPEQISDTAITLKMTEKTLVLDDQIQLTVVTKALFPNADPDAIGREIPIIFGALTGVPGIPIVAGANTTLAADAAVGATSTTVTDTSAFPSSFPFTMQIDDEQVSVGSKTATGFTHSALGAAHRRGAPIFEVRTGAKAYRFVICENKGGFKTKSVPNVYANKVLTTAGITIDLDETTLIPGKSFVVINFSSLPFISRATDAVDTIGVSSGSETTVSRLGTNVPLTINASANANGTVTMPAAPANIVDVQKTLTYHINVLGVVGPYTIRRDSGVGVILESGAAPSAGSRTFQWGAGASYGNEAIFVQSPGGNFQVVIDSLRYDVSSTVTVTKSGTIKVSGNSSADVLFGQITCDVNGIQDDSSGTLTGVALQLLENPTDITKFILTQVFPDVALGDLGSSWATTRLTLAGYKWAFILGDITFGTFRQRVALEARSRLFIDGGLWQMVVRRDAPPAVLELDYNHDFWKGSLPVVRRTPRLDVKNSIVFQAKRDYSQSSGKEFLYASTVEDLTQPGFTRPLRDTIPFEWVQDQVTADTLGAIWGAWRKRQYFELEPVTYWNAIAIELEDIITIANHPLLAVHGDNTLKWRVVGKHYLLGEHLGRIKLDLIETDSVIVTAVTATESIALPVTDIGGTLQVTVADLFAVDTVALVELEASQSDLVELIDVTATDSVALVVTDPETGGVGLDFGATDSIAIAASETAVTAVVIPAEEDDVALCRLAYVSATQIKLSPYGGDSIKINGTTYHIPSGGVTAANTNIFIDGAGGSNLVASTLYYAYLFDNGGTLTIDFSTTGHSADSAAGNVGIEIKTGVSSRSLVGMIRTNGSSQFEDDDSLRGVRSYYNRPATGLVKNFTANRTTTSTTLVEINTEIRLNLIIWADEVLVITSTGIFSGTTDASAYSSAIGIDGTNQEDGETSMDVTTSSGVATLYSGAVGVGLCKAGLSEGFHYVTLLGAASSGTATWYGATYTADTTRRNITSLSASIVRA